MDPQNISFGDDFLPTKVPEEIDLLDEKGNTYTWEVFYSFSLGGNDYLVFLPSAESEYSMVNVEIDDPDSEIPGYIVMKISTDEDGEEILEEILDPDELEEVQEFVEDEIGMFSQFMSEE